MVTGPGLSHFPCTSKAGKRNIVDLIGKESVPGQEQLLYAAQKNVVNGKGGEPGDEVRMTGLRGGNPLCVTVGKAKKVETKLITPEFMAQLQKKVELQHKKGAVAGKGFQKAGS